jgi:RNA polymerase sigma factor (sigma-70 family)
MDMNVDSWLPALDVVDAVDAAHARDGCGRDCGSHDGDRSIVLRDFLATNYARLHRRLLRYLGCPDLASDCLHDAWLRLGDTTMPATVRSPEAYVYRVACNIAMDCLRGDRSRQYTGAVDAELDTIADPSAGPDLIAEVRSDVEALDHALQHLPRRHQAILVALRIEELTRQEVAVFHGLSLRRVDTMLRQALDYCAGKTERSAIAGVRSSRRALPQERMRA